MIVFSNLEQSLDELDYSSCDMACEQYLNKIQQYGVRQ